MKKILAFLFVVFQQENLYLENKIKSLENNARYFESQAHPLFVENFNLKDQIISLTESIKSILKIITNNFMDLEILYLLISCWLHFGISSYDEINSNAGEGERFSWIVSRNGEENWRFRVADGVSLRRHGERIKG